MASYPRTGNPWRATFAALCATLVGIGLARFAYTPLIPALVEAGWFSAADAAYLGAANLAGYCVGAILAQPASARVSLAPTLRAMMVVAGVAFFACALPLAFWWFFFWRFIAGAAGGVLMVLAPSAALGGIPADRRGLAGGIIFSGVGLGIAASGSLMPVMLSAGLVETWCGLGVLALALTAASWAGWPREPVSRAAPTPGTEDEVPRPSVAVRALFVEYGLIAAALVPHMVFLADFVARGLGRGVAAGAHVWVLFGFGAMAGPLVVGRIADRIGFRRALCASYGVLVVGVGVLALSPGSAVLALSSLVVGLFVPGIVPLVLGRIQDLMPGPAARRIKAWSLATTSFALCQALGAYACSFLFAVSVRYDALFAAGAGLVLLALAIDAAAGGRNAAIPWPKP
jgi:predicted MFS family arabinose efflux permease